MLEQTITQIMTSWGVIAPYLEFLAIVIVFAVISKISLSSLRKRLIKTAKNKKQISDIKIFSRIVNITLFCIVLIVAFLSYIGSWSGLGIFAGLLTAGLGFALQKPITGIAAWIMMVVKRPFGVGDRIKIGEIKGEVYDITLTHVYIDETGGMAETEDHSGRNVMVPNYKFFETDIINYTLTHDLIIGEVSLLVSFDSDVDKLKNIIKKVLESKVKMYSDQIKKEMSIRSSFKDNGVVIKALFYAPVHKMNDIKSDITLEIFNKIKNDKSINFAAPDGKGILGK